MTCVVPSARSVLTVLLKYSLSEVTFQSLRKGVDSCLMLRVLRALSRKSVLKAFDSMGSHSTDFFLKMLNSVVWEIERGIKVSLMLMSF